MPPLHPAFVHFPIALIESHLIDWGAMQPGMDEDLFHNLRSRCEHKAWGVSPRYVGF